MNGHICWRAGGSDMLDNVILRPMVVGVILLVVSFLAFFSSSCYMELIRPSLDL